MLILKADMRSSHQEAQQSVVEELFQKFTFLNQLKSFPTKKNIKLDKVKESLM